MRTLSSMHFSVCALALCARVCVRQPFVTRDYVWAAPPPPAHNSPSPSIFPSRCWRTNGQEPISSAAGHGAARQPEAWAARVSSRGPTSAPAARRIAGKHRPPPMVKDRESRLDIGRFLPVGVSKAAPHPPPLLAHSNSRCHWSGGPSGHILSRSQPRGWGVGHGAGTTAPACFGH